MGPSLESRPADRAFGLQLGNQARRRQQGEREKDAGWHTYVPPEHPSPATPAKENDIPARFEQQRKLKCTDAQKSRVSACWNKFLHALYAAQRKHGREIFPC
jgi:hypothetical protein